MTMITIQCEWCEEEFVKPKKEYNRQIKNGRDYFFCGLSCAAKYRNRKNTKQKESQAKEDPITWSSNIAYLTGLITSDGTLDRDRPRIAFINSEFELIEHARDIVKDEINEKNYKPQRYSRGESVWWRYQFTSRRYYYFLKNIGLTPDKSLTINQLNIPNQYFIDFLRGEMDGDGGFRKYGSKFRCYICSGSKEFLEWLFNKIKGNIDINGGWIRQGNNVYELDFGINDSVKIAKELYREDNLRLTRKYNVVKDYLN